MTAKIYEIKRSPSDDFSRIRFTYHNEPMELRFDSGRFRVAQGDKDSDILAELILMISDYSKNEMIEASAKHWNSLMTVRRIMPIKMVLAM